MTTPFPFTSGQTLTAAQMNAVTTLPVSTKTASYTCVVGDVGSRIVMNVASGNTVTINNSIFAEGDTIFIANKGAGTTTVTAGAGVTINGSSLTLAQHGGGTLVALSASVFAFFNATGLSYGVATGGSSSSINVGGQAYTLLSFTSGSNTLTITKAGLFDILIAGGGGSGASGRQTDFAGGGGGAGQLMGLTQPVTLYLDTGTQTIVIGAGGAGTTGEESEGSAGSLSSFGVISIAAGGANGSHGGNAGKAGGSAGGAGGPSTTAGTATVATLGNNGGVSSGANTNAGGGGGFSAVGSNGATTQGGAGGAGSDISGF